MPEHVIVYDDRLLWHLRPGTTIRELGRLGRSFIVGARPGMLWLGATLCSIDSLELPVELRP